MGRRRVLTRRTRPDWVGSTVEPHQGNTGSSMIGASRPPTSPGDVRDRNRNRDDAAAERRWENEGGRLSAIPRPMETSAARDGLQKPQISRE